MSEQLHKDVFSWPSSAWLTRDKDGAINAGSFEAEDLGLELTDLDQETLLRHFINQAKEEGQDDTINVFDMGKTVTRYNVWKKCFPRVRPFFAIKSHDDPCVISLLDHLGAGFDCASKGEVEFVVNRLKISPTNVIYANPIKPKSHVTHAKSLGVDLMTFDNEEELYKIKQCHPNSRLLLRLTPEVSGNEEMQFNEKFGCDIKDAPKMCRLTKELGLNLVGICFNVGSGCRDAAPFVANIQEARRMFDLAADVGFDLDILDIGGGYHGDDDGEDNLKKMSGAINEVLDDLFPATSGVMIMAEPGRYFVESSLMLATCVIGKRIQETPQGQLKNLSDTNDSATYEYYIADSIFGMFLEYKVLGYKQIPIIIKKHQRKTEIHESKLFGQTCDPSDVINTEWLIPELDVGDWLIFDTMGAYTVVEHTDFNGFQIQPIRRMMAPQTWDSLFQS